VIRADLRTDFSDSGAAAPLKKRKSGGTVKISGITDREVVSSEYRTEVMSKARKERARIRFLMI
jgi:hypothetical protein